MRGGEDLGLLARSKIVETTVLEEGWVLLDKFFISAAASNLIIPTGPTSLFEILFGVVLHLHSAFATFPLASIRNGY